MRTTSWAVGTGADESAFLEIAIRRSRDAQGLLGRRFMDSLFSEVGGSMGLDRGEYGAAMAQIAGALDFADAVEGYWMFEARAPQQHFTRPEIVEGKVVLRPDPDLAEAAKSFDESGLASRVYALEHGEGWTHAMAVARFQVAYGRALVRMIGDIESFNSAYRVVVERGGWAGEAYATLIAGGVSALKSSVDWVDASLSSGDVRLAIEMSSVLDAKEVALVRFKELAALRAEFEKQIEDLSWYNPAKADLKAALVPLVTHYDRIVAAGIFSEEAARVYDERLGASDANQPLRRAAARARGVQRTCDVAIGIASCVAVLVLAAVAWRRYRAGGSRLRRA